jgi:hypothetical protein
MKMYGEVEVQLNTFIALYILLLQVDNAMKILQPPLKISLGIIGL